MVSGVALPGMVSVLARRFTERLSTVSPKASALRRLHRRFGRRARDPNNEVLAAAFEIHRRHKLACIGIASAKLLSRNHLLTRPQPESACRPC